MANGGKIAKKCRKVTKKIGEIMKGEIIWCRRKKPRDSLGGEAASAKAVKASASDSGERKKAAKEGQQKRAQRSTGSCWAGSSAGRRRRQTAQQQAASAGADAGSKWKWKCNEIWRRHIENRRKRGLQSEMTEELNMDGGRKTSPALRRTARRKANVCLRVSRHQLSSPAISKAEKHQYQK